MNEMWMSGERTAAEILEIAADLVEVSWAQGDAHVTYAWAGPFCAGIALYKARQDSQRDEPNIASPKTPSDHAWAAFCREIGVELAGIPAWNDAPGRTAEEVATALRNAKRHLVAP